MNNYSIKDYTYGEGRKGRAAGRVRLFVGNRGRVNFPPGWVQEQWPVDNSGKWDMYIVANGKMVKL